MTLEDAIQHHRKVATTFKDKDSEQLADWLTELQEYQAKASEKPKTNADCIRHMTDEELAKFMCLVKDRLCFGCSFSHMDDCEGISCEEARKQWLTREVSENDER